MNKIKLLPSYGVTGLGYLTLGEFAGVLLFIMYVYQNKEVSADVISVGYVFLGIATYSAFLHFRYNLTVTLDETKMYFSRTYIIFKKEVSFNYSEIQSVKVLNILSIMVIKLKNNKKYKIFQGIRIQEGNLPDLKFTDGAAGGIQRTFYPKNLL